MNGSRPAPSPSSAPDLVVVLPDGGRAALPEGEFRSLDGKLLFVRRGRRIEIRCPRSKALYGVEWESGEPHGTATHSPESNPSPAV